MHIPIKNHYFFRTKLLLSNSRCDCCVIVKTKPTSRCTVSMVAWRSHNSKRRINLVGTNSFNSFNSRSSSYKSSLVCELILVSVISKFANVLLRLQLTIMLFVVTTFSYRLYMLDCMSEQQMRLFCSVRMNFN